MPSHLDRIPNGLVPSAAKLNLALRIVGRRDDGYHRLQSLFVPLDWGDTLSIFESPSIEVAATWVDDAPRKAELPSQEQNLVYRALTAVEERTGRSYRVELQKRIPMGGGLGGGSSNAGAVLSALLPEGEDRSRLALSLGADVPFFLSSGPQWIEGIGEQSRPCLDAEVELGKCGVLLFFPPFAAATPDVFSAYRQLEAPFSAEVPMPAVGTLLASSKELGNDLERAASILHPTIAIVLDRIRRYFPQLAGMSGSGSTCFAVFPWIEEADAVAQDLREFCRLHRCQVVRTQFQVRQQRGDQQWKSPK